MLKFGEGITASMDGETLVLRIDLSKKAVLDAHPSKNAEKDNYIVAMTGAAQKVDIGYGTVNVQLTAYMKGSERRKAIESATPTEYPVDAKDRELADLKAQMAKLMQFVSATGKPAELAGIDASKGHAWLLAGEYDSEFTPEQKAAMRKNEDYIVNNW